MHTWDQLRGWVAASREELRIQRRLLAAAGEWSHSGRDSSFLATGARLAQFEALAEAGDEVLLVAATRDRHLGAGPDQLLEQDAGRASHEAEDDGFDEELALHVFLGGAHCHPGRCF